MRAPDNREGEDGAALRQRAQLCSILAGVFVEEAAAEFLAALRQPQMLAQLAAAGLAFDDDFLAAEAQALQESLAIEYTNLFVASGGIPPVESVRLYGRFKQAPNFDVMQTYRRNGFVLQPGRHEVFADHLGVELMFIAALLDRQADALDASEMQQAQQMDKEIKRFWAQHAGRWLRGYARLVERASEHSFYREMARLLATFVDEELDMLGLRIDDADQSRLKVPKIDPELAPDADSAQCDGCTGNAMGRNMRQHALHDLR